MFNEGDKVFYKGEWVELVSFYTDTRVVLRRKDGSKTTTSFGSLSHNLMSQSLGKEIKSV